MQINNNITFIYPFLNNSQHRNLSAWYPKCSQLCIDGRRCNIHDERPLPCRLYPLALEMKTDGTVVWAIHRNCLHLLRLKKRRLFSNFKRRTLAVINKISPRLLVEIVETYRAVEAVSLSDGVNTYNIIKRKEVKFMSKCKPALDSEKIAEISVKTKSRKTISGKSKQISAKLKRSK